MVVVDVNLWCRELASLSNIADYPSLGMACQMKVSPATLSCWLHACLELKTADQAVLCVFIVCHHCSLPVQS